MMRPTVLWLRRSTATLAFPAMLVISLLVLFSRTGWAWERSQAVSWATSATILLGPLAGGLVAFDVWRRHTATMRDLTATTRRGATGLLVLTLATWLLAVVAWLAAVGIALALAASNNAAGSIPWWTLAQGLVAMLACACIGALLGSWLRNVAAGPLTAVVCYALPIVAVPLGAQGVMMAGGATAPLIGITQNERVAAVIVLVGFLITVTSWLVARLRIVPQNAVATAGAALTGLGLAAGLVYLITLSPMTSSMQPSTSPDVCAGTSAQVCGPAEGAALYAVAAADLQAAGRTLSGDGIVLAERYDYPRGNNVLPQTVGIVSLSPSEMTGRRLSSWDIALTIATPAACPEYYGNEAPERLLQAQGNLATWIVDRITGVGGDSDTDAEGARAALAALQACDGDMAPTWTYLSN